MMIEPTDRQIDELTLKIWEKYRFVSDHSDVKDQPREIVHDWLAEIGDGSRAELIARAMDAYTRAMVRNDT